MWIKGGMKEKPARKPMGNMSSFIQRVNEPQDAEGGGFLDRMRMQDPMPDEAQPAPEMPGEIGRMIMGRGMGVDEGDMASTEQESMPRVGKFSRMKRGLMER